MFGLGNKQYEHFNAVGKRMHKNMEALGATAVCERGDGDDDDNIGEPAAHSTAQHSMLQPLALFARAAHPDSISSRPGRHVWTHV